MSYLIRRIDAMQACQVGPSDEWSKSTRDGYNQAATDCAMNLLRIPAVHPDSRIETLTAQLESTLKDRAAIIAERDQWIQHAKNAIWADNARLRGAMTGIKRAAAHRMQDDRRDLHSYYFYTADAALNTGKEPNHE